MDAIIDKKKIPLSLLGELNETDLTNASDTDLRDALERDGYLFLRNIINPKEIENVTNDTFMRL